MRVMFICPPIRTKAPVEPLGFGYLAAMIRGKGAEVKILDACSLFLTLENIAGRVEEYDPDIVGITAMTPTINTSYKIAAAIRARRKGVKIILGGVHPTVMPDEVIVNENVDVVVRGEGEYTFLELYEKLKENVPLDGVLGITFKKAGKIIHNAARPRILDIDSLPLPARDLLPMEIYKASSLFPRSTSHRAMIYGGRGCSNDCKFCASKTVWGNRKAVFRSAESILAEIEQVINDFNIYGFQFRDEMLTRKRQVVVDFCQGVINRKLPIKWVCSSTVNTLDKGLVKLMKQAGCCMILMGVESGSDLIREKMNKRITREQILNAFKITKAAGIRRAACFLLGYPGETAETFEETIGLAKEIDADEYNLNVVTPYPGTALYEELVKDEELDWERAYSTDPDCLDKAYVFYPCCELTQAEMDCLWKKFRREVELDVFSWSRVKMLLNRMCFSPSWKYFYSNLKGAGRILLNK